MFNFLLDLLEVDVRDSTFAIEDLGNLLECWASRLDVELVMTSKVS